MKYGYYDEKQTPLAIEEYTDGAHIVVIRTVNNFISTSIKLEDEGWELRDSIKVILQKGSLHATLFRKPFKGTVANNVLENGCGGINIDATRIKGGGSIDNYKGSTFSNRNGSGLSKSHIAGSNGMTNKENDAKMKKAQMASIEKMNNDGRFPANLVLECTCEEVIEGKSDGLVINNSNSPNFTDDVSCGGWNRGEQEAPRAYKDTGATHIDSNCPCKKLDIQSGMKKGNGKVVRTVKKRTGFKLSGSSDNLQAADAPDQYGDSGGASRFFFSFNARDELKEYLISLIRC